MVEERGFNLGPRAFQRVWRKARESRRSASGSPAWPKKRRKRLPGVASHPALKLKRSLKRSLFCDAYYDT